MTEKTTAGQVIKGLVTGKFANLGKAKPSGSLEARKLASGAIQFYWRFTIGGKTAREPIGFYDAGAPPKSLKPTTNGYSIEAAMRAAEGLAQKHQDNKDAGGYPAFVAAKKEIERAAAAAKQDARKNTLQALLEAYCDHQKALGRTSHSNALSIFKVHVFDVWPLESGLPANEIVPKQIANMMRKVREAGKDRTSKKLHSYARAAYAIATWDEQAWRVDHRREVPSKWPDPRVPTPPACARTRA